MVITFQENSPYSTLGPPDLAREFQVLANPERLAILQALMAGESDAAALVELTGIPQTSVRKHLRTLVSAGLVTALPEDGRKAYSIDTEGVTLLTASLVQQLSGRVPRLSSISGTRAGEALDVYAVDVPAPPSRCLTCSNSGFVRRVLDDLDGVLGEARIYHGQLQQLSSQVLTAHEAERKRIARELHDDTGQALTSILVRLRLLEKTADDELVRSNMAELRELTSSALDSVRRMAVDLRPSALDDLGLIAALHAYADKYANSWPIRVSFSAEGLKRRLPGNVELVLYRVVQEALTNVAKHSGAESVEVKLRRRSNTVTVTVTDDGRGFDMREVRRTEGSGLGLFGMRERLALVGGTVAIESEPGRGTTITARVPVAPGNHNHKEGE